MSHEFRRRGKNWFTAMGVLFILIHWGPEFVLDFFLNSEITNEKISIGMLVFGGFMIILGFRKKHD